MKERPRSTNKFAITPSSKAQGGAPNADVILSPDSPVINTTDGGGPVLTNVEVAVIFWGSYWNQSQPPTPSSDTYYQCLSGVVAGPYMTGLRQYRGIGPGTMLGKFINGSDPPNSYTDTDVSNMLTTLLQNTPSLPPPIAGHNRFYAVVTPPGLNNANGGAIGEHDPFTYNGVQAYYAWIDSVGGLADPNASDGVVNIFSHELAEVCSDPQGNAILVNAQDGTQEIGDICNNEFGIVQMNGVTCNVQCYWSNSDNACILPLGSLSFLVNKNTFGVDEVNDAIKTNNGMFSNAFWLALEDFSINTFKSFEVTIPTPAGPFANLAGVAIRPSPATPGGQIPVQPLPVYENPNDIDVIQRIRFSFDIVFASPLVTPFPTTGAVDYSLTATFQTAGAAVPGANSQDTINFELISGEDPYFSNIDTSNSNALSYLSQDLRVFTITQGESALPNDATAPVFLSGQAPYDYIQKLIGYLNGADPYTVPSSNDPLNGLPGQSGYETGDSSVTPLDSHGNQNYNFAIARVRMQSNVQGPSGEAADVRVFFRLWVAVSCDTDFDPYTTYVSNPGYPAPPTSPLPSSANLPPDPSGQSIRTTPFFATDKSGTNDYDPSYMNNNVRTITIPMLPGRDGVWAYYGCFLDVYDKNNNCSYPGTHHCIVAQIAYNDAPIDYSSSITLSPGNSDKLAQRNLQITLSGNPGPASTHRISQAFDTRPSLLVLDTNGAILNYPDELMIDWGRTPVNSNAFIYWPGALASDVLALASRFYGTQMLSAADGHTITCQTVKGVTYVPIPTAAGKNFAGLLTVDLPSGVRRGDEFSVIVRRIASRQVKVDEARTNAAPDAVVSRRPTRQRYIAGSFQIKIPVTTEATMLGPEENTLAILEARLENMSPIYRWYPVVERLIGYVSARVNGSGGSAVDVPPSLLGFPQGMHAGERGSGARCRDLCEHSGKIAGLIFDRFGEFEGFLLDCDEGERKFYSREHDMEVLAQHVWRDRLRLTVWSDRDDPCRPVTIVLREPPALFGRLPM
jgi:hypothetical protein